MTNEPAIYPFKDKPGACVIFNMETYLDNQQDTRDGTEFDMAMIDNTFTSFGYDVRPVKNPTRLDINQTMNTLSKEKHSASATFICFILTHGTTQNRIVTSDNELMDVNDIIQMSDIPALKGKPKIFVVQACRGSKMDSGFEKRKKRHDEESSREYDKMMLNPRRPDFLLIFATPPGYVSYRSPKGSEFIQMLCYVLEEERQNATVCVLLQRLALAISSQTVSVVDIDGCFLQIPYFMSTLRKSLTLGYSDPSDNIQFVTPGIIKDTQAELERRTRGNISRVDGQYCTFILKETNGCYDLSVSNVRQCFVINKTTSENITKAYEDCKMINSTMKSLNFDVSISNINDDWEFNLKKCIAQEGNIGCLFCFIQIDADDDTPENEFIVELIELVKNAPCMRNKPKIYIIQPYNTIAENEMDFLHDDIGISLQRPVMHSKESDVLMVQVLPVEFGEKSFIEMFCAEYLEHAGKVPMMGFLERVLPSEYPDDWSSLLPTVCSTMRKHLLVRDVFHQASYQTENVKPIDVLLNVVDTFKTGLRNIFRKF